MRKLALALAITVAVVLALLPMAPLLTQTQAPRLRVVKTSLVANMPAGLITITNTSAIAGYYCMRGMPSSGWSIMLNAYLNNGLIIQDITGSMTIGGQASPFRAGSPHVVGR